jgi:hypothetical protein
LKDKINELATNSKNKNIRDLYRGYISQLLNVYSVSDARQINVNTAQSLVPEAELAIAKLKR